MGKEKQITVLDVPLLANTEYTEWAFKMVEHLSENSKTFDGPLNKHTHRLLEYLVKADRTYQQAFDIFQNKPYFETGNRDLMEEHLSNFDDDIGKLMIYLIRIMIEIGITPNDLFEYYENIIKEQNLNVLQGASEPFNLSLQIGHYENYIISEVGWSLRGAFSIVAPGDIVDSPHRGHVGNRISNDSVYVMRIKQWDITAIVVELLSLGSEAKINIKAMELWSAVFNYLNYLDTKPMNLWVIIKKQYETATHYLIKQHADNK